jgi:hypothetical protein
MKTSVAFPFRLSFVITALFSLFCGRVFAQAGDITSSIASANPPIFIQGATGFENILTISNAPANTQTVWLCVLDNNDEVLDSTLAEQSGPDWIDTIAMGELDSTATHLEAHFYDGNEDLLDRSNPYLFSVKREPEAITSGIMEISVDSIDGQGIAYLELSLSLPDSSSEIANNIIGLAGKSFGFDENSLVLKRQYDLNDASVSGDEMLFQYKLTAFGMDVSSDEIDLTGSSDVSVTLDNSLNPIITGHFSRSKEFFNYETRDATLPLPITPASISAGAGLSVTGGISTDCYLGLDGGDFGFVQGPNGEKSNVCIGAKIEGSVKVTASLVSKHLAGIRASLKAIGTIGASYEYQTLPTDESSFHFGGNLMVKGTVELTGLAGGVKHLFCSWNPFSNCEPNNTILDGVVWPYNNGGIPRNFGDGLPSGLDTLFHAGLPIYYNINSRSDEVDSDHVLNTPDQNPQPAFASRGAGIAVAWIEADSVSNYLLFSVLDTLQNRFSLPVEVAESDVMLADPKAAIASDGSAIIVWTQSRIQASDITGSMTIDSLLDALDVWYAVYDPQTGSISAKSKIYDPDGGDLPSSKPGIAISDSGKALITWLTEDTTGNTDIWYAELENSNGIWYQSTPDIINDLPGNNYSVQVCFIDSVNAIAAWITDEDGDDSTGGNQIIASYYDGENWSAASAISNENSDEHFNEMSMDFNGDYGAVAYTSTTFTEEGEELNSIKAEIYHNGQWDQSNYFEFSDSISRIRLPKVSISDAEFAAVSYHTADIYEENGEADAGEVNIALKDLNSSNGWQTVDFSTEIAQDTSIYVWDMDVLLARNNTLYTLSQEQDTIAHQIYGGQYSPVTGLLFGNPNMGLVLRGMKVNPNLSIEADSTASLPETPTGLKEVAKQVQALALLAYPNPTHDKLTIEYSLPEGTKGNLEIWDLLGQRMATIAIANQPKGQVQYNATAIASGVYLLRLSNQGESKCIRIVIQ